MALNPRWPLVPRILGGLTLLALFLFLFIPVSQAATRAYLLQADPTAEAVDLAKNGYVFHLAHGRVDHRPLSAYPMAEVVRSLVLFVPTLLCMVIGKLVLHGPEQVFSRRPRPVAVAPAPEKPSQGPRTGATDRPDPS
jgi:hypothetical protein